MEAFPNQRMLFQVNLLLLPTILFRHTILVFMKTSVAFCTYNGEKYIREQLDSIFNQTLPVDEIIICDDRSSDNTIAIIQEYQAKFPSIITLHINEENLRSVKNFEKAISLCTNDIIFLSDQDDSWLPNKVEKYIHFFYENPNITTIASNGFCMDDNSKPLDLYTIWDVPGFLNEEKIAFDYFKLITQVGNFVTGAAMAFRKSFVSNILPFPTLKDYHHDEWIATIATSSNSFAFLEDKYFNYRVHSSQQVGGISYAKTQKIKKSLISSYNLNEFKTFIDYKRRLKKLKKNYDRNSDLLNHITHKNDVIVNAKNQLFDDFNSTLVRFKKDFPIGAFLLSMMDKITNKRKI